jgi:cytochrome P450
MTLHADVLESVRSELESHGLWTDRNPASAPTYDELQKCNYHEAVLNETLRLYPPVGGVVRHATDVNDTFKGYILGGADDHPCT